MFARSAFRHSPFFVLLLVLAGCSPAPSGPVLSPGAKMPEINAEGWINGSAVTNADLKGKVYVVDIWGYACVQCRRGAPELTRAYDRFQSEGVQFIGLTHEGKESLKESQEFLEELGISWPNGYGASGTISELGVRQIPVLLVVGKDGNIYWTSIWNKTRLGDRTVTLDQAIREALVQPEPKE